MKGSVRQRSTGSWELTVDLGRDALGRRQRRFVTVRGTKAQAQRRLRELLSTLDRGQDLPPDGVLLRDWLNRWMQEVITPNRRQGTKERYEGIIRRHIIPALGHVELTKLAPVQVQALEARLSAAGMAPEGVGLVHRVLSGAMRHALRLEMVYRNPVSLVSPPAVARHEPALPEIARVREALALARVEHHYLFPCIHLIAYTGLRRGEALGLTWDNVDLEDRYIRITASLVRSKERGLILEPPKTASGRRTVDLDVGTVEVLRRHREQQEETRRTLRNAYQDQGIVFADALGGWINPGTLTRVLKTLGVRAGHAGMTVRSLRHFHASVALQTGQNIVVVSKRLGHANVSITSDIYAHALPGWQRQAADAFAEAMEEDQLPTEVPTTPTAPHS